MNVDSLDQNLLVHPKKPGEIEPPAPRIVRKYRRSIKIAAYAVIFLISFVIFFVLKLPDSLVTNFLLARINESSPYHLQAEKVSFRFFWLPHIRFDKLELDPKYPGQGISLQLDEARIYPNPFSLLPIGGPPTIRGSFSVEAYKASFSGSLALGSNTKFSINADNLDLSKFSPLEDLGADAKGIIKSAQIELSMENQRFSRADGTIKLSGTNLILDPASFQSAMALPILDIGPVEILAKAQKGKLHIEKIQLGSSAKDIELKVEGDIQFSDPITYSRADLKIKIKPSEKLRKAIPSLDGMFAYIAAKRTDGFFATKISGNFQSMGMPTPDP